MQANQYSTARLTAMGGIALLAVLISASLCYLDAGLSSSFQVLPSLLKELGTQSSWTIAAVVNTTTTAIADSRTKGRGNTAHTLWLIACETRNTSQALASWMFTAKHFQKMAASGDGTSAVDVRVQNICDQVPWRGLGTKIEAITKFLEKLTESTSNSTNNGPEDSPILDVSNIVLFSDSDSFFNSWAVSAKHVLERFDQARRGKQILISAEPTCWNGSPCNQNVMNQVYPNATRSHCPQFVNSGQYMGYAEALLEMMKSEDMTLWTTKNRINDQEQLSLWYSKNTAIAQLDTESLVFRNMMTGYIDSRRDSDGKPGLFTCGPGDAVRNCSLFREPYWGHVNSSSLYVEMVPVPNCTVSKTPFSIHGSGPGKKIVNRMVVQLQSDYRTFQESRTTLN